VGILCIFADCKRDSKKKDSKFVVPFPPGTKKVPYVRDDLSINTSEDIKAENIKIKYTTETSDKSDTIQIQDPTQQQKHDKISTNPYDLPEDF